MIPSSKSLLSSIAPAILVASVLAEGNASVELLYRYNEPTWIENIAVRPNGLVLPARATSALLTEFNLSDGNALTLANQSDVANAIMGITEIVPDLFAMNTMECDLKALAVSTHSYRRDCDCGRIDCTIVYSRHRHNIHY